MSTLAEALRKSFESQLSELHICLPGKILTYDYTTQKATVKPLLKRRLGDETLQTLPTIVSVPVIWPRSGGAQLVFPVSEDDGVLLLFSERALETWLTLGGDADPADPRMFDLTDAIAIPGLNPFTVPSLAENETDLFLLTPQGRVQIGPSHGTTVEQGLGKLKIGTDNKVALGNDQEELLDLLDQVLDALIASTVPTSIGPQQLSKVTDSTVATIKTDLAKIKGSL